MEIKRYLPKTIYYRVKAEEDIKQVAKEFNTSVFNVKSQNQEIDEGDIVEVYNAHENIHIVKPLETLKEIAEKYKISEDELLKNNNLKSKVLFIGQRLKV